MPPNAESAHASRSASLETPPGCPDDSDGPPDADALRIPASVGAEKGWSATTSWSQSQSALR